MPSTWMSAARRGQNRNWFKAESGIISRSPPVFGGVGTGGVMSALLGTDGTDFVAQVELDTFGQVRLGPVAGHGVVSEGFGEGLSGGFGFVGQVHLDAFDEFVGVGAAEAGFAFVLRGVFRMLGAAVLEVVE